MHNHHMNLHLIQVNRSDMFKFYSECFYDIYILDHDEDNIATEAALLFKQFATEASIRQMFKDGYTTMLFNVEQMQRVEQLVEDELPFLIIIMDRNDVVATVHHHDVNY
jgi:hypothetical protein